MPDADLKPYLDRATALHATHAIQIDPATVVTAPWVRLKCQFGCGGYGHSYACPPESPTPEVTKAVVSGYRRAILYHFEVPKLDPDTRQRYKDYYEVLHGMVMDLEADIFKDGYYKAFSFLFGGCMTCPECAKDKGEPCRFRARLRPAMEASGIDVFQTVRNNGFAIQTLHVRGETRNQFCLTLVD